jgi:moderate conductance mechanosensitive channel
LLASFIFEDTFDVGEKVEILGIEGVVEKINLRTTLLRATGGEVYIIPNGEIRAIRNFSRGRFSTANITLKIAASDLNKTLDILEDIKLEAVSLLPNLLEPWQVVSETGVMGDKAELTLLTRTRFGKAAEMRPRLLALVQERLAQADISLAG